RSKHTRKKVRRRALLPTRETARCRPWHSKDRCRAAPLLCKEFPWSRLVDTRGRGGFVGFAVAFSHRFALHGEIRFAPGQAVFIRAAVDGRRDLEISVRGR